MINSEPYVVKAILNKNGYIDVHLRGHCMEPFLVNGDVVRIKAIDSSQIIPGNLCLIKLDNETLAIHRVIQIKNDMFVTKGDYSGFAEKCYADQMLGITYSVKLNSCNSWCSYDSASFQARLSAFLSAKLVKDKETKFHDLKHKNCKKLAYKWGLHCRKKLLCIPQQIV